MKLFISRNDRYVSQTIQFRHNTSKSSLINQQQQVNLLIFTLRQSTHHPSRPRFSAFTLNTKQQQAANPEQTSKESTRVYLRRYWCDWLDYPPLRSSNAALTLLSWRGQLMESNYKNVLKTRERSFVRNEGIHGILFDVEEFVCVRIIAFLVYEKTSSGRNRAFLNKKR